MKILFCSNFYPPRFIGGAELIAHAQAKTLASLGHEVRAFAAWVDGGVTPFTTTCEPFEGIAVTRITMPPALFTPASLCLPNPGLEKVFADQLAAFKPDVVHFHNVSGLNLRLVDLARFAGARTVLTLHDHWGFCHKNTLLADKGGICADFAACRNCRPYMADPDGGLYPWQLRQDYIHHMLHRVDWLVTPSKYLARIYVQAGFDPARFRPISNGIDLTKFATVPRQDAEGTTRFTFIGHLGPHKGLHTLLDALDHLPRRKKWRLTIVGSGALETLCREKAAGDLAEHIRFIGHVENNAITTIYGQTDVFVLPSIWPENQPVSITEAMACGLPVIASNLGGVPELVEDNATGLLFTPGDARDLARKMAFCLDNPDCLARFGQEGKKRNQDNTPQRNAAALLALYNTPPAPITPLAETVLCAGFPIDIEAFKALEILPAVEGFPRLRFLYQPWLDDREPPVGGCRLFLGPERRLGALLGAMAQAAPIIVSSQDAELARLCQKTACGLYFTDYKTLVASLWKLSGDAGLARTLGRNLARLATSGTLPA